MVPMVFAFCITCALLVSTVQPAAMVKPSIEKAEEHVLELAQHLDDIKNAVQPKHCNDILNGGQRTSGIYTIFHKAAGPSGQTVYCDMDVDGGGWTVIQQRGQFGNNVYYFYRNWTEYAEGFGVPAKEFWIGNSALHALTSGEDEMMLRVVLTNTTGDQKFVDYESVKVDNEENFFKLQLGKFVGPTGWDALSNANGQNFSTFDSDNDAHPEENCALHYRGAWWYNRCHLANLNGLNLNGEHESFADGIEWSVRGHPSRFYRYSYPRVRMMIRPVETPLELRSLPVAPPASP
ncbi:techylectin-5A-like [Haemaphysalis longicornis]